MEIFAFELLDFEAKEYLSIVAFRESSFNNVDESHQKIDTIFHRQDESA